MRRLICTDPIGTVYVKEAYLVSKLHLSVVMLVAYLASTCLVHKSCQKVGGVNF
jgi:multidrug transporter EmrE-like cation transporter